MHPFVNVSGTGVITLTRHPSGGENSAGSTPTITFAEGTLASVPVETTTHSVVVSTPINMTQSGSASPPTLIGSHFLTSPDTRTIDSRALDGVTKIEVETVPVSVVSDLRSFVCLQNQVINSKQSRGNIDFYENNFFDFRWKLLQSNSRAIRRVRPVIKQLSRVTEVVQKPIARCVCGP